MIFCKIFKLVKYLTEDSENKTGNNTERLSVIVNNYSSIFIFSKNFFTFLSYEKVLLLCEKQLLGFLSNFYVLRPSESEKMCFTEVSVCLSV